MRRRLRAPLGLHASCNVIHVSCTCTWTKRQTQHSPVTAAAAPGSRLDGGIVRPCVWWHAAVNPHDGDGPGLRLARRCKIAMRTEITGHANAHGLPVQYRQNGIYILISRQPSAGPRGAVSQRARQVLSHQKPVLTRQPRPRHRPYEKLPAVPLLLSMG